MFYGDKYFNKNDHYKLVKSVLAKLKIMIMKNTKVIMIVHTITYLVKQKNVDTMDIDFVSVNIHRQ